jgi:diphthamide biosynthesis protein 7
MLICIASYDSHVRLFDVRKAAAPIVQTNTGGGVWRVKWHPDISRQNDLLVACMHDGFKVLRYTAQSLGSIRNDEQEAMLSIVNRFDEHKSLAYGVDWSFAEQRTDEGTTIASCSFYDHLLCVWTG